ncbi:FAD-binding and (Fe-S)-binding domain-containing protein [Halanaeroarchaeum sulfurireducens]|uniref:D-lactate dehydrogenase (cytochrome) n=1 Tax=Halanaeroarchaeum sulfurireducens TaxID=1604004 RepID=A0A0F7PBD8_9EURY|nr:FAD-binding and (Fe-S)-binding domain-containing protein [Halanaeroarchaeum sulfurireducens]AKH96959.1 oxidoreductase (glycolate oxidase iron-sulfur subunit) [Halanaeroarchaeum sulfurireducens]ALG81360.1 oxidoreductase (glycolate oxidase iron-sulfur subunit) [Halanaeroarchaeum sulfurireducens]
MGSEFGDVPAPHLGTRAEYDHSGGEIAAPDLAAAIDERIDGDVQFDDYSRQLFATDGSMYEVKPIGIARPRTTADVAEIVTYCSEREIPVLPRGGGTSLAGQTVNEAIVLDFKRYMSDLLDIDAEAATATAEPGITLAELNADLEPTGLKYAPDPAWGDKSVLGGCIANNSSGSHSLMYEKADGYVESVTAVLADGTVTEFGWMDLADLERVADPDGDLEARIYDAVRAVIEEDADEIHERYPDLKRNVSGYNLDVLVEDAEERGEINVGRLLAGSEGTLAVITEATVSLEPIPETTAVAMLTYDDLLDAMEDVEPILAHDPAAVEVMDDVFLDMARGTPEFASVVGMLPEGTDSTLLVEFYADSEAAARRKVATLLADRVPDADVAGDSGTGDGPDPDPDVGTDAERYAVDAMVAHDEERQADFWKMRKAGLPILLSNTGDERHWTYIEDTAVPPENLPEYVADFQDILDEHDTFASYYAHAGPGVLHIRPLLNLKTQDGVEKLEATADAVTDLVAEYDGAISGEHGDGRVRTQWNRGFYGEDLWARFRELKATFDPDWILNPGPVGGDEAGITDMTADLRYGPDYDFEVPFEPELNWDNENGFQGMTELCHGCGGCTGYTDTTGGVMCPTYRAAEEEITSTRGRANLLRSAMNGELPEEVLSEEFVTEVLDLCISCKGCKTDCPSGVDMAKLKAEVVNAYHDRHGSSLRDKLFANVDTLASLASTLAPVANAATNVPGARTLLEETIGIARERSLPEFTRTTLEDWWTKRGGSQVPASAAERKAVVFADTYTNYSRVDVGTATIRVLEAVGVHVDLADRTDSGRPAYSKSFIDKARDIARENVRTLAPRVRRDWDVVFVEPSDAVMAQSDYLDLLSGREVETLAENAYGVSEYVDVFGLDENVAWDAPEKTLTYHGHCHQKGTNKDHHAAALLERVGYDVDELDSGCCGMAGTFGYEAEHHSLSEAVGEEVFDLVRESDGDELTAPGASCRTQFEDSDVAEGQPPHPAEELEAALPRSLGNEGASQ